MTRKTPLNELHRAGGARMVDFGGWDMPVNYGSQIEEHHAVRAGVGMFDVSHMQVVDVKGSGARAFLRQALANDVAKLRTPGRALYTCMLDASGGVVDDLIVYFFAEDFFRIVVNAGTASKDIAWLESLRKQWAADVTLTPRTDFAMIAVQGPQARETVWKVFPQVKAATESLAPFNAAQCGDIMVARTGYTGEDGFEIVLPSSKAGEAWQSLVRAGAKPCGLGARDTLRLEAGMNLYGQDMDERVSPLDAGLAWTVDLADGRDFVGREALEKNGQTRDFAGLVLEQASRP